MGAQTGETPVDVRSPSKGLVQVLGPTGTSVAAVVSVLSVRYCSKLYEHSAIPISHHDRQYLEPLMLLVT